MSICSENFESQSSALLSRIRQKYDDYERYNFTHLQGRALRAFFDLAQEFETLENLYKISVFVPKIFLGFDSCLYLEDSDSGKLQMVCDSMSSLAVCGMSPPETVVMSDTPYETGDSYVIPIRGNNKLFAAYPITKARKIIGLFEVFPLSSLDDGDRLFFRKYANRIGYNLHYKRMVEQNVRHIHFINTLVADIEHNVIVPNMKYKLFLIHLKRRIDRLDLIEHELSDHMETGLNEGCGRIDEIRAIREEIERFREGLLRSHEEILNHFNTTSLFLESLLRKEHFQTGQLVLRKQACNFKKDIIDPQLERYRERLERRGITIDNKLGGVPEDEEVSLAVDKGLISQVYANLFSNAEKYCAKVSDSHGNYVKSMSYGREFLPDFFGKGKHGIKFNVFTTGEHLTAYEAGHIFDEGFRAAGSGRISGTGRGLHFVKKIVEVHGGITGYESTPLGNNFYFILPLAPADLTESMLSADLPGDA
jgi:signal transduction histidine kinase